MLTLKKVIIPDIFHTFQAHRSKYALIKVDKFKHVYDLNVVFSSCLYHYGNKKTLFMKLLY